MWKTLQKGELIVEKGRIYCVMGKSASGKDTIYKELLSDASLELKTIVPYTTRPVRFGEHEGVEYHFSDETAMREFERQGKLIEARCYDTVHGKWYYFTVDDGQIDLANSSYIVLGTLESYEAMCSYYGKDVMIPVYIEVEDGIRLERALYREKQQKNPKYAEMCRRFLADVADFCEENIQKCGITRRYYNNVLEDCIAQIKRELFY